MFDIGFPELVVIGLVALVVIGPERLPKVARTVGILLGRMQRYVGDVKADINREMQLDEIKKFEEEAAKLARDVENSVTQEVRGVEDSLNKTIAPAGEIPANVTAIFRGVRSPLSPETPPPPAAVTEPGMDAPVNQLELGLGPAAEKTNG